MDHYGRIDGWPGKCWLNEESLCGPDQRSDQKIIEESQKALSDIDDIELVMAKIIQEIIDKSNVYKKVTSMYAYMNQKYNAITKFKQDKYTDPPEIAILKKNLSDNHKTRTELNQIISTNRARLYTRRIAA